jgi:predicted ArsR family transcriptional regulator
MKQVSRDRFGSRVGSQAAKIKECLSGKPITAQAIAEKTGLNAGRVRDHLAALLAKKWAKKTGDGEFTTSALARFRFRIASAL